MIQYPDFTGMTVKEAGDILASEYPGVEYHMIYYTQPRVKDSAFGSSGCRIIRQRVISGRLEFTVSPFQNNE